MVSAITALTLTYSFVGQTLSTGDFGEMHIALKSPKLFKMSISIWSSDFFSRDLHTCNSYLTLPLQCRKTVMISIIQVRMDQRLVVKIIWPLKVIKTLFTYFNHQIKSITSLNCNMTLIQFVFSRGDSALC